MRQKTFDDIVDRLPYSMNSISTIRTSLTTMTHSDWRSLSKPRHTAYIREYLPRPQMLVTIHMTLARTRKTTDEFPPLRPNSSQERTRILTPIEAAAVHRPRRKRVKLTRHGVAIPALPSKLVKRIAIESMTRQGQRKPTIDRASLKALEQATEWFFEQIGEDLEAYSNHAGRTKRVDASDVVTLIRRQRAVNGKEKLGDFAVEHLPPEALRELRLPEIL